MVQVKFPKVRAKIPAAGAMGNRIKIFNLGIAFYIKIEYFIRSRVSPRIPYRYLNEDVPIVTSLLWDAFF